MPFATSLTTVLFDLDGTLLDTAPDMAAALNRLLAEHEQAPLPYQSIRPHVSHGARAMIRLGFGLAPGADGFEDLRRRYLDIYSADLCRDTGPLPGIDDLVRELEHRGIPWGVVTNKPAWLTDPLMCALALHWRPACVISGDTAARPKPHPDPMLLACERIGSLPGQCLYVGDAERDIAAGRAAGMATLAARWGYIVADDDPLTWGASAVIDHPQQVLDHLDSGHDPQEQ